MRVSAATPLFDLPAGVGSRAAGLRLPETDRPLAGLAGSPLSGRFRHWCGLSGTRYLFSTFPLPSEAALDDVPRYAETVVLAVRRHEDGARTILMALDTGTVPDLIFEGRTMRDAVAAGANEVHMHLLTEDGPRRHAIVEDFGG